MPIPVSRYRLRYARSVWTVTTKGDLPDEREQREHDSSIPAWDDYWGRILELEIHGYERASEGAAEYGRLWECDLSRGAEQIRVSIERTG